MCPDDAEPTRVTWTRDIKPMFREFDRDEMLYLFDLWSYSDVREFAELIYDRISDGTMPCDVRWSQEQLNTFAAWMETECLE
jgi:hypothetical protein